jgi:hypothetical protein
MVKDNVAKRTHNGVGLPKHRLVLEFQEASDAKPHKIRLKQGEKEFLETLHRYGR